MWTQFLLQNLRFSVFAFGSVVMLATAWLYWDSTTGNRKLRDWLRVLGFGLWAMSLAVEALRVEGVVWGMGGIGEMETILYGIKMGAGLTVLVSMMLDPLIPKPKLLLAGVTLGGMSVEPVVSVVWALVGWSYLRRASVGLERHLYRPALGIGLMAISSALSWSLLFRVNSSVIISKLVSPFGLFWCAELGVMLLGELVLARWVFGYLLRRFETQLVLVISMLVLGIYLVTTMTFSSLVMMRLKSKTLDQLFNQTKLLEVAINTKQDELLADAKWLANSDEVVVGVGKVDKGSLFNFLQNYLANQKMSGMVVTNESGVVVVRGEDREKIGDSLSSNALIKDALAGKNANAILLTEGGLVNVVRLAAATSIRIDNVVVGTVMVYSDLDASYVDGLKKMIGSDILVYAAETLSVSTLAGGENQMPLANIKMMDGKIKDKVLLSGGDYSGELNIIGMSYLVGLEPLKSSDGQVMGMVGVIEPEAGVVTEMSQLMLATFMAAIVLLFLSEIPAFLIARYIAKQLS